MKKGIGTIGIVIIVLVAILIGLIGWWQYSMYVQRKNIEKIENEIMSGTYPGIK